MEQLQFNDHFQGEGFDPVQQVDLTRTLDRKNARLNRADEEALAQVRRNNQVRIQNAQDSGDGLIALGKLSGKLSNLLGDIAKERQEEQDAEDVAFGFEMFLKNGLDMSGFNETMGQAKEQAHTAANAEAAVLNEDGTNYEASSAISKSTAFSNANQAKGFAMGAMGEYGTFMEQTVNPTDYQDRASYVSARRLAMKDFMKRAGLSSIKPQFLASTIYPKIAETEAKAVASWSKQNAIDDSAIRRDESYQLFSGDMDVATVLDATRNTVDSNGKPLGYKGAWTLFDNRVTEMRQAGMLTATDIESMKSQPIPGDAKGRTYGDLYEARFNKIERQVSAESRKIFAESEAERQTEFKQAEQQLVDAFIDGSDGDGFTDAQIDDAIDTLRDKFGFESSELAVLKKNTVDAKTRKKQELEIQDLISMNLLTPERLKKYDPKLQKTHLATAQAQANLRKENGDFKVQEDAIKDMVEHPVNGVGGIVSNHPNVGLMVAKQQRRFHELVASYALSGDPNPADKAYAQVREEFNNGGYFKTNGDPISGVLDPTKPYAGVAPVFSSSAQQASEQEIKRMNGVLTTFGKNAVDLPDNGMNPVLFTKPQLETMAKGFGEEGWSPSPAVEHAANILDMDPLALINKLRETNGMDELPPSPAMEVMQNQLSPTQQRLLRQFKTPERSTRGLIGQTQYNPEMVPKGYGKAIQDASSKYGVDPSIIAGVLETESAWNPNAISSAGAKGLAQIMDPTAAEFGANPYDPASAIDFAAKYIKYLMDYFKGDVRLAIFAYNGGMGNIERYGGPIPGNSENQDYYGKVIRSAGKYGYGKQALTDPGTMRSSIAQQL